MGGGIVGGGIDGGGIDGDAPGGGVLGGGMPGGGSARTRGERRRLSENSRKIHTGPVARRHPGRLIIAQVRMVRVAQCGGVPTAPGGGPVGGGMPAGGGSVDARASTREHQLSASGATSTAEGRGRAIARIGSRQGR